jgi:NAD(P)-dependent dehydrogenase (short-subunit alcohol dehydrogenase family)
MPTMASFVTGGSGFIGRRLLDLLLAREEEVHLLVRSASRERVEAQLAALPTAAGRVHLVEGDLTEPLLGVSAADTDRLAGSIDHVFHLAALYDMTASAELNELANVDGTREAVRLAGELRAGVFHHVSSIAVAGEHKGLFREDHFDEGQKLPSAYHRTKFEAERIVRSECPVPWRVYRPAVVVGDSRTGEMDKIDGPYYFFTAIKRLRHWLPEWVPLVGPELGHTNLVPVDFVAAALDAIAHAPGLDGQAFHLTAPRSQRIGEVLNAFAGAAHAPKLALRVDSRLLDALPKGVLSMLLKLPQARDIRRAVLDDLGIPDAAVDHMALVPQFDTRDTERALAGTGIEVPALDSYADKLWDYWERTLDPDLHKDRSLRAVVGGRTVLITGASSGIGRAAATAVAAAGGIPVLVARTRATLEEVAEEIRAAGGEAHVYDCDLADMDAIEDLVEQVLGDLGGIDVLVNNAGRSIRRSVALSHDRFHDYERTMALNYFGAVKLILGLLPSMRERRRGHIVNVSSIGVQTSAPRFSAYVASKAALDAFSRVTASEVLGDGITFSTIHMPLVRTPMIAPTKIYDAFPAITPTEAGEMVCEAIRAKPKTISTRLGTTGEVAYALMPKVVDQVLHLAYKVFPDSTAARGDSGGESARTSGEQVALAHLLKGVHW